MIIYKYAHESGIGLVSNFLNVFTNNLFVVKIYKGIWGNERHLSEKRYSIPL